MCFQGIGCLAQCAGSVHDVINQYAGAAFYFADDVHDFADIRLWAAFVDDGEISLQFFRHCARPDYAADIGRYYQQVFVFLCADIIQQHGGAIDIVYGHVKESLNLFCVQVNCQYTIHASTCQHVSADFCADRHTGGSHAAILACIAEIRHHSGDACGRRTAQRICHEEQFHQVAVGRRTRVEQ